VYWILMCFELCIVYLVSCFVVMCILLFTLDSGPLARCQCSEGPSTDHLDTGFLSWFPCVLKANAEVVPKYPRCHYMLLM
jgi:hypothetical protein